MTSSSLIFLIGSRGSGKTTVARLLAERLGWSWTDADAVLEARFGRSIRAIFAEEGEEGFRLKEAGVLADLAEQHNVVVATGGGVVLRADNRAHLKKGLVIWLTAPPEVLFARIQADPGSGSRRPALGQGGFEEVRDVLQRRTPLYEVCADFTIDTAQRTPAEAVEAVLVHHGSPPKMRNL